MKTRHLLSFTLVSIVAAAGCLAGPDGSAPPDSEEDIGEAELAACSDVSGTNVNRSLVVTDPEVLAKFSFKRTMDKIRTTAQVASTETTLDIYQTWMKTFTNAAGGGSCDAARVDPNNYGIDCPRAAEAKLGTVNPFPVSATVKFEPVGIFNRFDLAPTSGAHCGEYRIVYAMTSTNPNIFGRAFIIFEAALANPTPELGVDACLPVAQFWQSLTTDASVTSRAAKLEKFYFTGGAVAGFTPVVNAAHYGLATNTGAATAGQVRTNFFMEFEEWHLREFKLRRTCADADDAATCTLDFQHVTVKVNPAEELFAGGHSRSAAFRTAFIPQVKKLASTNLNTIKMGVANQFNEWESVSQATNVRYATFADTTIRGQIQAELTALGSTLTVNNILNRATTQTCAGCHQVSVGQGLGGGLTWPGTLGFVHIDESSNLSAALTGTFLPHRKTVLEKFINDRCTGTAAAPVAGETVGGAPEDSAN